MSGFDDVDEAAGQPDFVLNTVEEDVSNNARVPIDGSCGLVRLNDNSVGCPVFLVPAVQPTPWVYRTFVDVLGLAQPVYGLRSPEIGWTHDVMNVPEMVIHYVTSIRQAHPHGPYAVVGYSFGALLAFEIANRLAVEGHEVRHLVMLDPRGPSYTLCERLARPFTGRRWRDWLLATLIETELIGADGLRRLGVTTRHRMRLSFGEGPLTLAEVRRALRLIRPDLDPQTLSFRDICAALISSIQSSMVSRRLAAASPTVTSDPVAVVKSFKVVRKNLRLAQSYHTRAMFDGTITLIVQQHNTAALRWQSHSTKPLRVIRTRVPFHVQKNAHWAVLERANIERYSDQLRMLLSN